MNGNFLGNIYNARKISSVFSKDASFFLIINKNNCSKIFSLSEEHMLEEMIM